MKRLCFLLFALSACTSAPPHFSYPTDADPAVEIQRMDRRIQGGLARQYDVLASSDFVKSQKYLKRALASDTSSIRFWENLGWSRAYLRRARERANARYDKVVDVLSARHQAIAAGARAVPKAGREIGALDDSFRANAPILDRSRIDRRPWDLSRDNYLRAEILAIQEIQLAEPIAIIDEARRGARAFAPKGLRQADELLTLAIRDIAAHPHDRKAYEDSVARAKEFARVLPPLTEQARRSAFATNEELGRELLAQQRDLDALRTELRGTEAEAEIKRKAIAAKEEELRQLAEQTNKLARDKALGDALENAGRQFKPEEAEVYRQGDKLLIRLKDIRFATGRADLPARSLPLLNKVKSVIKDLNAKDIVIEGHTDGTGAFSVNQKLSTARARTIAQFVSPEEKDVKIETQGFADSRPLASNKTALGRAQNRRVDLILTPSAF
jgi:outer membrane protein OmpA-like peptidoglycan-associated protein